jgi:tetratricopeptide (TPR) repeat protein
MREKLDVPHRNHPRSVAQTGGLRPERWPTPRGKIRGSDALSGPFASNAISAFTHGPASTERRSMGPSSPTLRILALSAAVVVSLVSTAARVEAHKDISAAEHDVAHALEKSPDDANLYLRKATLERKRGAWDAAAASYLKAAELGADSDVTDISLAAVFSRAGLHETGLAKISAVLDRDAENGVALLTRARIYAAGSRTEAAAAGYRQAITRLKHPEPGVVFEAMDAQLALGEQTNETGKDATEAKREASLSAISVADIAMNTLGPIPAIQGRAVQLETELERYDEALTRLDTMLAQAPRHDVWIAQRGDLLLARNEPEEAVEAYNRALELIRRRPQGRRSTKIDSLEKDLLAKLAHQTNSDEGENP